MESEANTSIQDVTDQLESLSLEARETTPVHNGQASEHDQATPFIPTDSTLEETCAEVTQTPVLVGSVKRVDERKKKLWQTPAEEKKFPKIGKQKSEVHHRPTKIADVPVEVQREKEPMIDTLGSEKAALPEERTSIVHGPPDTKCGTSKASPVNETTNSEPFEPHAVPDPLPAESVIAQTEPSSSRPKFTLRLQPIITIQHGDKLQLEVRFTAQPEPTVRTVSVNFSPRARHVSLPGEMVLQIGFDPVLRQFPYRANPGSWHILFHRHYRSHKSRSRWKVQGRLEKSAGRGYQRCTSECQTRYVHEQMAEYGGQQSIVILALVAVKLQSPLKKTSTCKTSAPRADE